MKKLIFLISTEGKSKGKIAEEAWKAWKNYQKVDRKLKSAKEKPISNRKRN